MHNNLRNTRNCFPLLDSFWLIIYSSMDLDLDPIQSDGLGHGYGFNGTMDLDLDMDPIQPDGLGFGYGF